MIDIRSRREPERPELEYYQAAEGKVQVEEASGPIGAWIEFDPNWGRSQ
jgi:hypothetical protein